MDRYNRNSYRGNAMYTRRSCGCANPGNTATPAPESRMQPDYIKIPHGSEKCLCTEQPISLAMAYVPEQPFCNLYSTSDALAKGTLFAELYMPYCTGGCSK